MPLGDGRTRVPDHSRRRRLAVHALLLSLAIAVAWVPSSVAAAEPTVSLTVAPYGSTPGRTAIGTARFAEAPEASILRITVHAPTDATCAADPEASWTFTVGPVDTERATDPFTAPGDGTYRWRAVLRDAQGGILAATSCGAAGAIAVYQEATAVRSDPSPRRPSFMARPTSTYDLYDPAGFRYQDPYYRACVAAATMDMLNFIASTGTGGPGFRWRATRSSTWLSAILKWTRGHDTLPGSTSGSDPHGWRNALNWFGWGSSTLYDGSRVYDDRAYGTFDAAMKDAVRAIALTGKPVGLLAWAGRHAHLVTGFYGLRGDPFAVGADGQFTNAFTVRGFYLSDPLYSQGRRHVAVSYAALAASGDLSIRFRRFAESDSTYDDPYTPGSVPSRLEWYSRYVVIMPLR